VGGSQLKTTLYTQLRFIIADIVIVVYNLSPQLFIVSSLYVYELCTQLRF